MIKARKFATLRTRRNAKTVSVTPPTVNGSERELNKEVSLVSTLSQKKYRW